MSFFFILTSKKLAEDIAQYRKEKAISLEELSKLTNIPVKKLQDFENNGEVSLKEFLEIVKATGASIKLFLPQNRLPDTMDKIKELNKKEEEILSRKKHTPSKITGIRDLIQS